MYYLSAADTLKHFGTDGKKGLTKKEIAENKEKYGSNLLTKTAKHSLLKKITDALFEPMLIILLVALTVTFGINIGKAVKTGDGDFIECAGVFIAIVLSVAITIIMEGKSEKAFELLNEMTENVVVKVLRNGLVEQVSRQNIVVGDVIYLSAGEKVVADGRLLSSNGLSADESMLSGESKFSKKDSQVVVKKGSPLQLRKNMVFSGTLITEGEGLMLVTAVGDTAEMGKIAKEVQKKNDSTSPLNEKLNRLSKTISIIGGISAFAVFLLSLIKLIALNEVNFENVRTIFMQSIVLIVAAVPEGLPTIVAISLSLNVLKLAKENALIKKIVVAETAGCVSIICSDKTGTLTQNKMTVESICTGEYCTEKSGYSNKFINQNIVFNSTADIKFESNNYKFIGNSTECALLVAYEKSRSGKNYNELRELFELIDRKPFNSQDKYMSSTVDFNDEIITYIKGAPETIMKMCALNEDKSNRLIKKIENFQREAKRVIAFAHQNNGDEKFLFDGFAVISDPLRKDVKIAVNQCREAGIRVKILTGDNQETAESIARQLNLISSKCQVITADFFEKLSEADAKRLLENVVVIARSTPLVKLKIVKLLKESGEIVAVTGDGINDAPALKQADIGIAMGSGAQIAKETGDVILLDDSFTSIVKAISFGRGIYQNFQRFILFQLSVNFSAMLTVVAALFFGFDAPFSSLQLLWLNLIMDGPPALTLGLESPSRELMRVNPTKRSDNLVTKKLLIRIILNSVIISSIVITQMFFNYLNVGVLQSGTVIFTMFVLLQLFNAFNCREMGGVSILKNINGNKPMLIVFALTFLLQFFITQFGGVVFGTVQLDIAVWLKVTLTAFSVIILSELYKFGYNVWRKNLSNFAKKRKLST